MKRGIIRLGGPNPILRIPALGQDADTATQWLMHETMLSWQLIFQGTLTQSAPTMTYPDIKIEPSIIAWSYNNSSWEGPETEQMQYPHPRGFTEQSYSLGPPASNLYNANWVISASATQVTCLFDGGNTLTKYVRFMLIKERLNA